MILPPNPHPLSNGSRGEITLKVLVIGNGAREHALVWKLAKSKVVSQIFAAPGNAGTAQIAVNLDIKPTDIDSLSRAALERRVELVVVGPEAPLADGIVDHFQKIGIPIFGPTKAAAQIEASKAFSKMLLQKYGIPCAKSQTFSDQASAARYIRAQGAPLVVKADGLAAGKGVIIADTVQQAIDAISGMMQDKNFGPAGDKVVIEEKLSGREMSFFAFSDGKNVLPMVPACDYKRVFDGDLGPNTGGMGSYSPPVFYTSELGQKVLSTIVEPAIQAMEKENRAYKSILYSGLMIYNQEPKVLEFNARFGDPECQVTIPRLKSDLLDIILGVINGNLKSVKTEWTEEACVGVVLVSSGYPGNYKTGFPITGLDSLDKDIMVFHAGTKVGDKPGQILTNGGRVLTVAALGKNIREAREKVYANIPKISFEGCQYRKDIAKV
jgi:phosphoribosylamine---glycine ligase